MSTIAVPTRLRDLIPFLLRHRAVRIVEDGEIVDGARFRFSTDRELRFESDVGTYHLVVDPETIWLLDSTGFSIERNGRRIHVEYR
jgi:hypothetical protein